MNFTLGIGKIHGLPSVEEVKLRKLIKLWDNHKSSNDKKNRYYGGHVRLSDVNLGIALPNGLNSLEIGCEWGAKTVDVLAARSMFDGFVSSNGKNNDLLQKIMSDNRLISEYMKACKDQLKYGCTFATLSADEDIGCKIRFHSPLTASAIWNGEKGRIDCGLAIIDTKIDNKDQMYKPSHVNLYTDTDIWELTKISDSNEWEAEKFPHIMGRPLMEPLVWNATSDKPFGRSRIKEPVRRLIEGYVRTVANASIALEFSTTPQKYLLGITDEQYDALINEKFKTYVGSIIAGTTNPDTGQTPEFGQLSQGTLEPHVQMLRMLATQFSAATGLTVTDTGVVNDANPTSSDAILAQSQTLVLLAEQLNTTNSDALKVIARMAQAIVRGVELDKLTDEEESIVPHFKNPAMPSVSVTADAAVKIASVRPNFSQTDTFLEMVGFDQADIRRINAQEQRSRGTQVLSEEFNADISE
ncbi:phage portal protein [Solobacterium moorei]|uniref:phage portal protein n=1 Tax=Solobacterium moorei TaxID=102148 RepID=UPI000427A373|nr:phage portal protein [Solobacterium moorei]BET22314.1 phage portal protein [Solobacterium moorei]